MGPEIEKVVIDKTINWLTEVVIGHNFCPFASKPVKEGLVHYQVVFDANFQSGLETLVKECLSLDNNEQTETILIIFPESFLEFDEYLEMVSLAEKLLSKEGYEGIYQIASFHPQYIFSGSDDNDPANYTNRSPYPMLHLLREESIEIAIEKHPNPDSIPSKNIEKAKKLGLGYFQSLWNEKFK
jgi:hypothetical protein